MRSAVFAAIAVIGLMLAGLVGAAPGSSAAQEATAQASPPPPCVGEADAAVSVPSGEQEAVVQPSGFDDGEDLYLAVITLEEDSCIEYRYRSGAVVLYVVEGPILYTARLADAPDVQIKRGNSDGLNNDGAAVAVGTEIELQTGEWITQDRRVWFTFRTENNSAIVSAAVFAIPPWEDDTCLSACRNRP